MLVRQLVGRYAGDFVEMPYADAANAAGTGAVEMITNGTLPSAEINRLNVTESAKPKRRGGWPKGKPRKSQSPESVALI